MFYRFLLALILVVVTSFFINKYLKKKLNVEVKYIESEKEKQSA